MHARSRFLRLILVAWMAGSLMLPAPVLAQSDARIVGVVRDQSGSLVADARVTVTNNRTDEARTTTSNAQGYFAVPGLKPSTYTVKVEVPDFAPIDYPGMELRAAQELNLDFELRPAGVTEEVTVSAEAPIIDISSARIGANVSEREVEFAADQRAPDVPAAASGARLAEQRNRHLERHPVQRPRDRAERRSSTTASRAPPSSTRVPATSTARFRRRSSCRRASRTCRSSASSRAAIPPSSGRAPAARSASSPSRAATRSTDRRSSTSATTGSTRRTTSTPPPVCPKSLLRQNQFGGSLGGPLAQGPGVLLRQLRRVPPERRHELRRGGAERGGRGRAPCRPFAALRPGLQVARRGHPARRVDQPGLRHRAAPGRAGRPRGRVQRPARLHASTRAGPRTSACSTTRAEPPSRKA